MVNEEVLRHVDPAWHVEFRRFIETGEASEGFLRYLDTDEECQKALDGVFASESASVAALAKSLRAASEERGGSFPPLRRSPPGLRFALAASFLFALLAGFAAWNLKVVERAHASRLATLERQNLEAVLAKDAAKLAAIRLLATTSTIAENLALQAETIERARSEVGTPSIAARLESSQKGIQDGSITLVTFVCRELGGTWEQNQKICIKGGEDSPYRPQAAYSEKLVARALAPSRRQKRQESLHISYLLRSDKHAPPQGTTPPD
jgi:hypothetical protein